jgi:hypothetical protein
MSNNPVIAKHFVIARSVATKQPPVIAKPEGLKQSISVDCFGLRPRNDSFTRNDSFNRHDSFTRNDE